MAWVIAGIGAVLAFDIVILHGIAVSLSAREDFSREAEDREQIKAIQEYNRKHAEKAKNRQVHIFN